MAFLPRGTKGEVQDSQEKIFRRHHFLSNKPPTSTFYSAGWRSEVLISQAPLQTGLAMGERLQKAAQGVPGKLPLPDKKGSDMAGHFPAPNMGVRSGAVAVSLPPGATSLGC